MFSRLTNRMRSHHQEFYPFGLLVVAQVCVLIMPAFEEFLGTGFILSLMYSLVILLSIYIVTFSERDFNIGLLFSSFTILFLWISYAENKLGFTLLHLFSAGSFFVFCAVNLWRFLYRQKSFNINTIFGAIAGYMYIGFICAMVLSFIEVMIPNSYADTHLEGQFDMIYLSFVTITTLGYGDVVPIDPISRSFAVLFAIAGQLYLTVILAIIVGQFLKERSE